MDIKNLGKAYRLFVEHIKNEENIEQCKDYGIKEVKVSGKNYRFGYTNPYDFDFELKPSEELTTLIIKKLEKRNEEILKELESLGVKCENGKP